VCPNAALCRCGVADHSSYTRPGTGPACLRRVIVQHNRRALDWCQETERACPCAAWGHVHSQLELLHGVSSCCHTKRPAQSLHKRCIICDRVMCTLMRFCWVWILNPRNRRRHQSYEGRCASPGR
jgi:hypothetical protein